MFGHDFEEAWRARRIQQFFDTIDKHSSRPPPRCRPTGPRSRRGVLPSLKTIKPSDERARQALQLLSGWNGVMDKERPEPLIFTAFLSALHRILLIDRIGVNLDEKGPFAATTLISLVTRPSPGATRPQARSRLRSGAFARAR